MCSENLIFPEKRAPANQAGGGGGHQRSLRFVGGIRGDFNAAGQAEEQRRRWELDSFSLHEFSPNLLELQKARAYEMGREVTSTPMWL